jgi:hypothetical protein
MCRTPVSLFSADVVNLSNLALGYNLSGSYLSHRFFKPPLPAFGPGKE